ncbi:DUF3566 domain-containing protein [Blastococcus sp. VKM Ac-2987]|uniref:DUF3566 domain-containing protein n=1 Tax=Blastococcus sp. VKM Ac-2987 TaxID=3004141 RepID=UPI0022AB5737|nr:DUF3566 domain-containing protein [Blastococcus sp. VKM Ac-2987]MCZ2858797.1 DUF3566 domain-containing protein [Blastococcus sp. VKM Ac-2987]
MSDRTQGSVRSDSRAGDGAPVEGASAGGNASATQSIPTTGAQRAQGTGAAPAAAQPVGPETGSGAAQTGSTPATAATPDPTGPADGSSGGLGLGDGATGPVNGAAAAPKPARGKLSGRGPRRARLQLRHIDTWSALKISLVLSIALFFIWMVAVGLLYLVLNGLGVFDAVNDLFGQIGSASGSEDTGDLLTPGVVFGGAAVIGAINVVLLTALCTVGTFIYNLCSDLVGGLEVTLSERD